MDYPTGPTAVLVCGSRNWLDPKPVTRDLNRLLATSGGDLIVIHGAARGADSLAAAWAKAHTDRGAVNDPHPADWDRNRKAAGPIRNRAMLKVLLAHRDDGRNVFGLVYRSPGKSSGTDDMAALLKDAKVPGKKVTNPTVYP